MAFKGRHDKFLHELGSLHLLAVFEVVNDDVLSLDFIEQGLVFAVPLPVSLLLLPNHGLVPVVYPSHEPLR